LRSAFERKRLAEEEVEEVAAKSHKKGAGKIPYKSLDPSKKASHHKAKEPPAKPARGAGGGGQEGGVCVVARS